MAIPVPGCNDGPNELLRKILLGLPEISGGGGSALTIQDEGVTLTATADVIDFVGAGVTATAVGNTVTVTIPGGASSLQSGSQAIGSGVDTISVVFPVAFGAAPDVIISVSRPVAENLIHANIDSASVTAAGFTASLGATTGSANYVLTWIAN